jgi:hypothetical protein
MIPTGSRIRQPADRKIRTGHDRFMLKSLTEQDAVRRNVQQQSGGWAMTGKGARRAGRHDKMARTIEGMEAIPNMKTMAGSPGADFATRPASRHLAHGFYVCGFHAFAHR